MTRADTLAIFTARPTPEHWRGPAWRAQRTLHWRGDDGTILYVPLGCDQVLTCTATDWDAWVGLVGAVRITGADT